MSNSPDQRGKLVRLDQNPALQAGSTEAFAAILETIKELNQEIKTAKELRENLWEKLFSLFDAGSISDQNKVFSLINVANREIQDLVKQKAQMKKAIDLKRDLNPEELEDISDELETEVESILSEIISKSLESKLSEAQEEELVEINTKLRQAYRIYCRENHPDVNQNPDIQKEFEDQMKKAGKFKDLVSTLYCAKDIVGITKLHEILKQRSGDIIEAYEFFNKDFDNSSIENLRTQLSTIKVEIIELNLFLRNIESLLPIDKSIRFEIYYEHLLVIISEQKTGLIQQNKEFQQAKSSAIIQLENAYFGSSLVNVEKSEIKFTSAANYKEVVERLANFVAGVIFDFSKVSECLVCENDSVKVIAKNTAYGGSLDEIIIESKNDLGLKKYKFRFIYLGSNVPPKSELRSLKSNEDLTDASGYQPINLIESREIDLRSLNQSSDKLFDIILCPDSNLRYPFSGIDHTEVPLCGSISDSVLSKFIQGSAKMLEDIYAPKVKMFNELGEELAKHGIEI